MIEQQPQNKTSKQEGFSFMVDISGSVGGSDHYWHTVSNLLTLHGHQVHQYYFWDSAIELASKKQLEAAIANKTGRGGTSPELVATQLITSQIKKLILITDGQVSDSSVNKCDELLRDYALDKSICYIISVGYGNLNMSVTCPFTRMCDNQVYEKHVDKPLTRLAHYTPEDYKILDSLDDITLGNFEANFEKMEGLIIALNMGKEGNIPLKNQLVTMKNRLVKQLSQQDPVHKDINLEMRGFLQKKDFASAMEIAAKLTHDYFGKDITGTLEKKVSHLINLCGNLKGQYNINQIKSNKMAWAKNAEQATLVKEVEVQDLSSNPIQCPIIMDHDVPQILIDECQPVLLGLDKFVVDDIVACPLRILNYPEVKAKLKTRLSNFMGVKFADKFMKNPFTQNKLLGAIPLGCHHSHVQVGNHTIAKLMSGGKILGNLNMFYAVIWHIIKEKEVEYLIDVEKNVTEHLLYRLKNSKTFASMSGLAQFVTTQLSTDVALWYCVNSGHLNQPPDRDTFRFHVFNLQPMIEMVELLGYPIDKGVLPHFQRTKALLFSLSAYKKMDNDEKKQFKQKIRCLTQNCVKVDKVQIGADVLEKETFSRVIAIDGPSNQNIVDQILSSLPKDLKVLPMKEIVHIGNILDSQKSAADYDLQYDFVCSPLPEGKVAWEYGLKPYKESIEQSKICPRTFRPYSEYKNVGWECHYREVFNVGVDKCFKGRKYFQDFLIKYNRMPNVHELIVFYYNRYLCAGKTKTLPYLVREWAQEVVSEYKAALKDFGITVNQALSLLECSREREERLRLEDPESYPDHRAQLFIFINCGQIER